jgi:N-acetylglutamate synthase-like GNAT family acetyltransferase
MQFTIEVANDSHFIYAVDICEMIEAAAKIRGTGIAKREPDYVKQKMAEGKAVVALDNNKVIGFCYIESWEDKKYVANSGLIVHPDYRKTGLARSIKQATFELSKKKFPQSKLFGITTNLAVMKINSDLGYKPVTFSELTQDEAFWKGCEACVNYDVLIRTNKKMCYCTAMVYNQPVEGPKEDDKQKAKAWDVFMRFLKIRFQMKKQKYPALVDDLTLENNKTLVEEKTKL